MTTSDRKFFRCAIEAVGRQPQLRWTFTDSAGRRQTRGRNAGVTLPMHDDIGPPATAARFLDELQTEVEVWWRTKLALGQGNMNRRSAAPAADRRRQLIRALGAPRDYPRKVVREYGSGD